MGVIDRQGRVFGQINLVDLGVVIIGFALTPVVYYGYRICFLPRPAVHAVAPNPFDRNVDTALTITGTHFSEQSAVSIGNVFYGTTNYIDPSHLRVRLPLGTAPDPGTHAIRVHSTSGFTGVFEKAFVIVGEPKLGQEVVELTCLLSDFTEEGVRALRSGLAVTDQMGRGVGWLMEVLKVTPVGQHVGLSDQHRRSVEAPQRMQVLARMAFPVQVKEVVVGGREGEDVRRYYLQGQEIERGSRFSFWINGHQIIHTVKTPLGVPRPR